ncbi:MAG: hypothetical protein ACXABY_26435, partial [Candidatus Thorarchaeota archaeon]
MKLMVASWSGAAWNAEVEETKLRSYTIEHSINEPAKCIITLADVDGTLMQKYNADAGDVYLGVGYLKLEDPTGTDIFYGRIKRVTGNSAERTVILECYDWLDQLNEEHITYDMREKLNGNVRQSTIRPDYDNTDANGIAPANNVAGTFYVYDHDIGLTADAHNGMKMILTAGMAGNIKVRTGPYAETVTASNAPMASDSFDNDIGDLWTMDTDGHSLQDADDWFVEYAFKTWVDVSNFFDSITGGRIIVYYTGFELDEEASVELYNGATYDEIGTMTTKIVVGRTIYHVDTFTIPDELLATVADATGITKVKINAAAATGGTVDIRYIAVELDVITTGYNTAISITDGETYRLTVGTDLSADATKVWDGLPYCVAQEIYKHIDSAETPGTLITGGDGIVTLTCAATIEHTAGISTRQYKEMTRLQILQDLAQEDMASFWITLGGTTVTWKKTFGADTMQLTDAAVESWQSLYDYNQMTNEYHVYGARIGDAEIYQSVTNAASQTKYLAARSRVIRNAGIVSDAHAKDIGTTLAARDAELSQMVGCEITGNTATAAHATTIKLGEIVEITSSYLWPTASK